MRDYLYLVLSVVVWGIVSCTKVDELSDNAEIKSCEITASTEGIELGAVSISNNIIFIPLEYGRKLFPLTIETSIQFSSTTKETISPDGSELNLKEFTFNDVYSSPTFYLISESGVPHLARIVLLDKNNADITNFTIMNHDSKDLSVSIQNDNIRIMFKHAIQWPVSIEADITHNGTFKDYTGGTPFKFNNAGEKHQVTIIAENGDERVWNIQIVPSIENSDFEKWINEGTSRVNIDPIPGKGLGWASANNTFVQGTQPTGNGSGKAAQITTSIQNLASLGVGKLVTAGTLFAGYFKINISALDNPASMTYFGIPFILRPESISLEAKYIPGKVLQHSVKENDKSPYVLTEIPGVDQGRVWIKLLHWDGKSYLEYHDKEVEGLTVLGEGEWILEGTDKSLNNWTTRVIKINYNKAYNNLEPTHISIVMTSSLKGDYFIGAEGSTLTVDNLIINY